MVYTVWRCLHCLALFSLLIKYGTLDPRPVAPYPYRELQNSTVYTVPRSMASAVYSECRCRHGYQGCRTGCPWVSMGAHGCYRTMLFGPRTMLFGPRTRLLGPRTRLLGPRTRLLGPRTGIFDSRTGIFDSRTGLLTSGRDY